MDQDNIEKSPFFYNDTVASASQLYFNYWGSIVQISEKCWKEVKKCVQAGWKGGEKRAAGTCDEGSARLEGKVLKKKKSGESSSAVWLRDSGEKTRGRAWGSRGQHFDFDKWRDQNRCEYVCWYVEVWKCHAGGREEPKRRCMDVVNEVNDLDGAAKRKSSHWSLQDFIGLDQNANWLFFMVLKGGTINTYLFQKLAPISS